MCTTLATRIEGRPSAVAPIGVDYEQVDPYTRHVIHALFPAPTRGYTFYRGLLANAIVTHDKLSRMPQEMRGNAAVVQVTGYAELSQYIGLSYETTHMYVLIYRALGLLYLEKHDGLTTIILPLGAYRPPAGLGETLLQLRERYRSRRPKVGRLVSKIVERIVPVIQPASQPVFDQPPLHDEPLDTGPTGTHHTGHCGRRWSDCHPHRGSRCSLRDVAHRRLLICIRTARGARLSPSIISGI